MKHLHLIVSLSQPPEAVLGEMPALRRLLARAAQPADTDAAQAICTALGVTRQQDWPSAPLLARAEGLDADSGYWLRADPVAYEIGMNGLLLRRPHPALDREQAEALATALGPDLGALGGQLFVPDPQRWYLRLSAAPELTTQALETAMGRSVPPDWLAGRDSPAFLRLMNSVQMALHQHPLNSAREQAGALPVNGLWLWGGGVSPSIGDPPDAIWGKGLLAQAMARATGIESSPLPAAFSAAADGRVVAVPEMVDYGELDRAWFAPLASALRWFRLGRLSVSLIGVQGRTFTLTAKDLWSWQRSA